MAPLPRPRIRTVRVELLNDPRLGPLSHAAHRLWLALWAYADDEGRIMADPAYLRAIAFAYHQDVTPAKVADWLREIADTGFLVLYTAKSRAYGYFPEWKDYQRIDRPQPSKLPNPEELPSTNPRERSRALATPLPVVEGNVVEGNVVTTSCPAHDAGPASEVLRFLNQKTGKHFRPKPANLALIKARLADGIHDWQLRAIINRKTHEWRGTERERYLRPKTLFNRTNCEQYLGELPKPAEPEGVG